MPLVSEERVEVPEGVEIKVSGRTVEVSGPKGKLTRTFAVPNMEIKLEGRTISARINSILRKDKAAVGTFRAHILNMVKGVTQGYVYKLRIVYSHFPITAKVEGRRFVINNFLGERSPRFAKIVGDTSVEVNNDEIIVSGINKEDVGQTAINIEKATAIRYRDLRTFQDGCYITEKL